MCWLCDNVWVPLHACARSHIPVTLGKWEQYLPVRRRFLSRWFMTLFYGCTLAHCMGMMWLYVAREFPEQSDFVPTPQQLALDAPSLYLAALYWGFGACVGTINPGEPAPGMQSVFSIFVSFTGVLFVAYTIGSVHRMVGHMQKSVAALRHKLNTVDRFMKHNDMPTELRDKVLRYHTVRLCCMLCCTHLCGCVVAWLCVSGCARVPVCVAGSCRSPLACAVSV